MAKSKQDTSSSSLVPKQKKDEEERMYNLDILERDLANYYRTSLPKYPVYDEDEDSSKIIMYRMNCAKNKEDHDINGYEGRVDFRVPNPNTHWIIQTKGTVLLSKGKFLIDSNSPDEFNLEYFTPDENNLYICNNPKVSLPHCKINGPSYPDDAIWVTDLKSEYGTFVNGRRIRSGERTSVRFGDIIGLGAPYDTMDQWGNPDDKNRGFVFTVKNFGKYYGSHSEPEEPPDLLTPTYFALNNVVILPNILKFLELNDLKSARLVNRYWKSRVDPKLFSSSSLFFSNRPATMMGIDVGWNWDNDFPLMVSMIRKHNLSNWHIKVWEGSRDSRVHRDVKWLLEHMGHRARQVRLMSQRWPHPWGDFLTIMSHLRNLHTLEIQLRFPIAANFPSTSTFPSVTKLSLRIIFKIEGEDFPDVDVNDDDLATRNRIISQFPPLFPNIQTFEAYFDIFHPIIHYIDQKKPEGLWGNLKELIGTSGIGPDPNHEVLNMISTFPQHLTKIELRILCLEQPFESDGLQAMLNHHSHSLTSINLTLTNRMEGDLKILRFPSFLKLKAFKLRVFDEQERILEYLQPRIMFPSGSVCYEKDLPEIRKLEVLSYHPSNPSYATKSSFRHPLSPMLQERLEVFVPKDVQTVSRTMRWVDFGIKIGESLEKGVDLHSNPSYKEFLQRFIKMFPFVNNPSVIEDLKSLKIQE